MNPQQPAVQAKVLNPASGRLIDEENVSYENLLLLLDRRFFLFLTPSK